MSKKYMHPSRKKILEVAFGNGGDAPSNVYGWKAQSENREVGDEWVDTDGTQWVQEKGFKINKSKYDGVREYLQSLTRCKGKDCKTIKKTQKHLMFIRKTGYCIDCLAEKEHQIRTAGIWNEYEKYKIAAYEIDFLTDLVKKLTDAFADANGPYEFVTAEGKLEKWSYDGDIEELKTNIQNDIVEAKENIEGYTKIKENCWEIIKDEYAKVFTE